jgi:hypothetical protein
MVFMALFVCGVCCRKWVVDLRLRAYSFCIILPTISIFYEGYLTSGPFWLLRDRVLSLLSDFYLYIFSDWFILDHFFLSHESCPCFIYFHRFSPAFFYWTDFPSILFKKHIHESPCIYYLFSTCTSLIIYTFSTRQLMMLRFPIRKTKYIQNVTLIYKKIRVAFEFLILI